MAPAHSASPPRLRAFRIAFAALTLSALAVPMVAMLFTGEVNWGPGDFVLAAGMLALLGLALEGALRFSGKLAVRAGLAALALAVFLLVWAELAVGLLN